MRAPKVAAPVAAVVAEAPPRVAPAGPDAIVAVMTVPPWLTGLPCASSSWMTGCRTKATPLCAVPDGSVRIASCAGAAGCTVTVAVCAMAVPATLADTVFVSAVVEVSVPAATPFASVVPGGVRVLLLPVAVSVTVFPPIGFPNPSSAVTVIVAALPPTVIVCGAAVTVVREGLTAPARLVARKFRGLATPVACTA